MSTMARIRRPPTPRRPVCPAPAARRGWGGRLASALGRRMGYAWSRWMVGERHPPAEAVFRWLTRNGGPDGVPAVGGAGAGCPGATGGAIETVLKCGARDVARRWAGWLLSIQRSDGSLPDGSLHSASLFNTAQVARGLLALESELPDVRGAALSACRYLRSRIGPDGRIWRPESPAAGSPRRTPPLVYLACLPPLLDAARRFSRPNWEAAVRRALTHYQHAINPARRSTPTHVLSWWIETLIALGCCEAAEQAIYLLGLRQRRDGSVPALPEARWVSSPGMAHLAACWYKLGQRDRADRAMQYLARRQGRSGGFRGSWGRGACYHAQSDVAWTAKHYLDAAVLQVQANFDCRQPELPDRIDPADGRVQAVRRWVDSLPADARVADAGCGKGRYLEHLGGWFPRLRLTGIDVSPAMLAHLPQYVTALHGSLLRIPADDGALDGAFAVESLEHALLPEQAIAELCRIVRPGGRILIIDKHRARQPLSLHEPWERWFTPEQLAGWLSRHCDEVTVEPISHLEGQPGNGLFLAATGRLRSPPSGYAAGNSPP